MSPVVLPEAVSATCSLQWKPPQQTMRVRRGAQGGLSLGELTGFEAFFAVFHVGSNAFPLIPKVFHIFQTAREGKEVFPELVFPILGIVENFSKDYFEASWKILGMPSRVF